MNERNDNKRELKSRNQNSKHLAAMTTRAKRILISLHGINNNNKPLVIVPNNGNDWNNLRRYLDEARKVHKIHTHTPHNFRMLIRFSVEIVQRYKNTLDRHCVDYICRCVYTLHSLYRMVFRSSWALGTHFGVFLLWKASRTDCVSFGASVRASRSPIWMGFVCSGQ